MGDVAVRARSSRWEPVLPDSRPPISPPVDSGIRWEFTPGHRVQYWLVDRFDGVYEQAVTVVVDRSAQPQHVYVRAFPAN